MAALDADVLTLVLNERANPPIDPGTKKPIERAKERVDFLIETLAKAKTKIIIPTPVLSEVLVESGPGGLRYIEILQKALVFGIEAFDVRAAIELAEITRKALQSGDKREGSAEPYQKIKLDRQIVAICKVQGVRTLYTSDRNLEVFAMRAGLSVIRVDNLPLPPVVPRVMSLFDTVPASEGQTDEPEPQEVEKEERDPDDGDIKGPDR